MPFSQPHPFIKTEIEKVPKHKGVYQLYYADGEIVYIGSSEDDIPSRLREHKSKTKFIRVKAFSYMRVSTSMWAPSAKHTERKLCKAFRKKYGRLPHLQQRSPLHIY